ncbi:hypothetical protein PAMP_023115 [Pampus punctatissimus]
MASLPLYIPYSLSQVATVTWARGHHPENVGVCVCTPAGGPESGCGFSPSGEILKSRFPTGFEGNTNEPYRLANVGGEVFKTTNQRRIRLTKASESNGPP